MSQSKAELRVEFREPAITDAEPIWNFVRDCDSLEENSLYCYLLLCRDFADTCLIASVDQQVAAFVAAYKPPTRPDTIFVWQIGVGDAYRRHGLGLEMLRRLVHSLACRPCRYLEANVTPSNSASLAMFRRLGREMQAEAELSAGFGAELFGNSGHEAERLIRIGPMTRVDLQPH